MVKLSPLMWLNLAKRGLVAAEADSVAETAVADSVAEVVAAMAVETVAADSVAVAEAADCQQRLRTALTRF